MVPVLLCLRGLGTAESNLRLQRARSPIPVVSHHPRAPLVVAPSGRCPCVVHPKPEICISCSGLVIVCCSSVAGRDHVASCSSRPRTEVVKSVKTKPPEVVSLVLPLLQVVCGRHCQKALLAAQGLGGIFFPNFKSRCKSSRKLEWFPLLPVRQCARRLPIRPRPLLSLVGRPSAASS
jgi:hypothetical protein